MMRWMRIMIWIGGSVALMSCSTNVKSYEGRQPEMRLERFFDGPSKAWGVVTDRWGKVRRRFTAELVGEWKGSEGTLSEVFTFDDGEVQKRRWNIKIVGDRKYVGTADDVDGEGHGSASGFAMNWRYTLKIKTGGTVYHVPFDDSMFLIDERSVMNKARMTKFGIHIGDILIFIQKKSNG